VRPEPTSAATGGRAPRRADPRFGRRSFTLAAALLLATLSPLAADERVALDRGWRFLPGDDAAYARPDLDDSAWQGIEVGKTWEAQGHDKLDGYGWYRLRFILPRSLKEMDPLGDGLRIALGRINNFDQTYLNGCLIGTNGRTVAPGEPPDPSFIGAPQSLWNTERAYAVPMDDPSLRWGEENVLAVRVFDEGGLGGLWTSGQNLRPLKLSDYVEMDAARQPFTFGDRSISKTFRLANRSERRTLDGQLALTATGSLSGKVVHNRLVPFELAPGASQEVALDLPQGDEALRVEYRLELLGESASVLVEESPYVLTPATPDEPRINGPEVTAARPGRPLLFTVPASGVRPMTFAAQGLPEGLTLDPAAGIIAGRVQDPGTYPVTIEARNAKGAARRRLDIVVGDELALTPPMGWNSWNCWGLAVDEEKVVESARLFVENGLQAHGWSYVNIDDGWEIKGDADAAKREENGDIRVNEKFPNMTRLGDRLHAMGLKFGIYSSPGPLTCGGYTGSYQHEANDARSFARWGVDYLKYDWCSYESIARDQSRPELMRPYQVMRQALDQVDRDILYSLCQYGMGKVWEWGDEVGGQLWRTTGDITDSWESMRDIGFAQVENAAHARPGHWNDPDMLVVGWVGWGPALHPSALTPDEQYTHISLWSLLSAPLLIGCDLARLDPFTLSLLTNDEVLALDQDRLGRPAAPKVKEGDLQVWLKDLADGSHVVGVFNLGDATASYTIDLAALGLDGRYTLRDVWRQRDLGVATGPHLVKVPRHGVVLLRLSEFHSSARESGDGGRTRTAGSNPTHFQSGESL
jgi:alpha-galactosidase